MPVLNARKEQLELCRHVSSIHVNLVILVMVDVRSYLHTQFHGCNVALAAMESANVIWGKMTVIAIRIVLRGKEYRVLPPKGAPKGASRYLDIHRPGKVVLPPQNDSDTL